VLRPRQELPRHLPGLLHRRRRHPSHARRMSCCFSSSWVYVFTESPSLYIAPRHGSPRFRYAALPCLPFSGTKGTLLFLRSDGVANRPARFLDFFL
jgi:hypothetical protein